ncbi:MAG: hypothetical protein ACTMUB_05290 [cyanobacterium endosymbiont of Rhopalodia musculus]|uniref:hypothetical protein n=1 Tax=cyanobacterium endosymbiont of Epithemia clementina EcSB TaxID=3034674 RepID=UPI002480F56E|nr:hypothetical protein [cyanobacterium endosymbiont of Epithemia clementina EcSB]WGT67563.1 hypothetical protein P3F56_00150 [cyanobacterium endosymbiont of Epithemia clementina EcSB]
MNPVLMLKLDSILQSNGPVCISASLINGIKQKISGAIKVYHVEISIELAIFFKDKVLELFLLSIQLN